VEGGSEVGAEVDVVEDKIDVGVEMMKGGAGAVTGVRVAICLGIEFVQVGAVKLGCASWGVQVWVFKSGCAGRVS
jgi:hypothetical protein